MEFPKQIKDTVYRLLQEPTLDHFREFLQDQTGEHNAIDFKQEWIEKDKLAKFMLALANYGGGIVVFGVHENDDKTFSCDGLKELQAKEQIGAWIKPYLSSSLKYDVYDFSYQTSEYEALKGKQFQMLLLKILLNFCRSSLEKKVLILSLLLFIYDVGHPMSKLQKKNYLIFLNGE